MKMPITGAVKPKPTESTRKSLERAKPAKTRAANSAESELKVPAVRKSRASSCPRDRRERTTTTTTTSGLQGSASQTSCKRRARSICAAPKSAVNCPQTTSSLKHAAVQPKCREMTTCPREQRSAGAKGKHASQSYKAFTVIPPNPKKRREIQRKAEAELAALEELRLSRAMAYVSINPSSVGGCLSLEEVRLKQQEEMMQAKRKQK